MEERASFDKGTRRSFDPFPDTRTILGLPFTASSGSDIISETRIPVAYKSVIKQIFRDLKLLFFASSPAAFSSLSITSIVTD